MKRSRPQPPSTPELTRVVHQNIAALVEFRRQSERNQTIGERVAQQIVRFLGSFWSVLVHTAVVTIWIIVNTASIPALQPFDPPPFPVLAVVACLESIFL